MPQDLEEFVASHREQLDLLNIPSPLFAGLWIQLQKSISAEATTEKGELKDSGVLVKESVAQAASISANDSQQEGGAEFGRMVVICHLCSWDMINEPNDGMYKALQSLSPSTLAKLLHGLKNVGSASGGSKEEESTSHDELINSIMELAWSQVILYRDTSSVRATIPAPPFFPQVEVTSPSDSKEADLMGPFIFHYENGSTTVDCHLAYMSPDLQLGDGDGALPTIDVVPLYSIPNALTRSVRYSALLGSKGAPSFAISSIKGFHANFVERMHLRRQKMLDEQDEYEDDEGPAVNVGAADPNKIWKVYADGGDPMELGHPDAGLKSPPFEMTTSIEEADIVYSCFSLFAPGKLKDIIQQRGSDVLINQFPYEGALVQKDHLGREILNWFGLPRPSWAVETYDLDVQFGEFVGAALFAEEREGQPPLWIIKPAKGTQSQGHVVTRNLAHVLRMVDAGGGSKIAQRYIERPVCYDGRKVDCRCLVMMTSASPPGRPTLYMHKRVYFRIAGKTHRINTPMQLMDHESVLSAMHLVNQNMSKDDVETDRSFTLPVDYKTIAQLEKDYGQDGFQWEATILPKIQTMIKEVFCSATRAYPAMGGSGQSRALYGIDVMFEISQDGSGIEPKLTEVSFCPSNNAVCDAYERDEELYRTYNTDIFKCLFFDEVSDNIIRLV